MGLREKVTITLVIIALTQIAFRHCMPRTPRKASLKHYLNDLKPVKNNPGSTAYSPSKVNKTPKQTFGKTAQNGRISQKSLPTKSLYDTYNFPDNEYPLDNAPRDRFRIEMNFNDNNHVNTLQKARNLQSSAINDLKKEMKMKRKLLSNKQVNNENIPMKTDMSSIKIASDPDSVRLLDPKTFPEVQYPLNTMETWGQNYWNYLPITQEKLLNGPGQHGFNTKVRETFNQPFTRLTKAKASKFLQSYDKLKEEHKRTSTENSKRSNVGQKGLNFTKTATCERVSDDFITASLFSNTLGIPLDTKTLDPSYRRIANSAENTCPLIENPCQLTPLPYKVIEENFENVCPTYIELDNNTQELEDADSSVLAKTLQLIEEILLNDDTSSKEPPKNKNKEKENNVNTTETDYSGGSANKDISINLIDNAETSTVIPIEELSHEISDDAQADILPYNLLSLPEETIPENTTLVAGPLNVKTPVPFTEPITYDALSNASSPHKTNTTILSNVNSVPGYTSIIIIPMNNDAVGKSQSHIFETTSDKPIIVYLPSTQSSSIPSQTPSLSHIVSSSLGNPVPNNRLYSDLSNMAPVQNDNPSSTALVSELLNSISDSGSSLPIHKTLPTNSKCFNNENSPSSMREKPVSDILIYKSLIDETPFVTPNCNEKWSQLPLETDKFVVNPDTPPQTPDFEHPVFDFADSDIASLSQRPYYNVINNELPIIAREINSDHQITDTSSKDLVIATQNITTGHLHKMTSMDSVSDDSLSESPNGVPTVALDKDFSSETPTDSLEILKNHLSDSLSNLSNHKSTSPSPTSKQISESPIDGMPPAYLVATPTVELPTPTEASLTYSPVFETFIEKLPEIMDTRIPPTIVSDITSDRAPQPVDNTPGPSPILNSTPRTTDLIVKMELYKIRQILDRMLSSETSAANQPPSMDTTLSPILDTDSLPLLEEQSLSPIQTSTDSQPPLLDKVLSPIQTPTYSQPPPLDKVLSPIQTTTDSQPPPLDKVLSPIQTTTGSHPPPLDKVLSPIQATTDSQPPPLDKVLSPIQTPTDSQPPPLDKVLSPIQTITGSQPPPLDKVLSPIQATTDSQPPPLDKVLSPIQTPTDSQPPPLDKVLSPIQTITGSQPPPLDKVLSPIQATTDRQPPPLDKVLSPIQTTTDSQPPPLDKVLSPIQTPTDSQFQTLDKELSRIQTPTNSQPPPLDKVLPRISDTDSLPLLEKQSLSPIQTPTDSQPPPLYKVLSPLQTPTDSQPAPLDKVLSPIQTTTDSQPPPFDKVLSPIQTHTDSQPPPLDKLLSPISDTDSLSLLENQSLSPTQTPANSVPLLAGDNMNLTLPVSDSPIDSSQQQDHKKLLKISINDVSKDTLPSPTDKSHLSNLVSDSIESPPQSLDETVPPILLFETTIDNKPYLIENLVTPFYETVTSRTKDITNNGLPYKMDESPLKMDLGYPDTYEVYDDHLPLSIDDLPIKMHKENSKSPLSIVDLPTDEAEAPNLLSKTPVNDLLKPTEVLSLPVERVLEIASPGFPSDSNMILLNESMENEHQPFSPSKDAPNGLPALPTDEVRSPIHKVIPNSQTHEISSETQPQKYDLPLPVDKLIPDISLSDALSNKPFGIDDSPSPIPDKISEIPNSTTDTKHPPLVENRLLSPEDYASPDTLVPDNPIAVLPSLNEALQSTYLDKTTDEVLSSSTLSGLHRDDLPLSASKTLPLPDITLTNIPSNKTLSTSKLPITKALLENVLSDITEGVWSSQVAKALPVTPPSYKTVFYVYESPLSETKEIPLLPVENFFPNAEHNDNLIDNLDIPQITEDSPTTNLPFEFPLPIDKMYNDKLENSTDDAKGENENETQTTNNLSDDQPLPKDKSSRLTDMLSDISRNEKSSSKIPITKALLENVLSEINTQGFSIPVSKAVPYTSFSVLDKSHYNMDSSLSDFAEDSPPLPEDKILPNTAHTDNNLPFSGQSQDTSLEENKTLSEILSIDISTAVSSSMDKIVPNDDLPSQVTEILPFPKDTPSDSPLSSYKIQTPSFPKLPIAKALLENVLSDINTKGLSMPVAKALPVASRSLLDKTLYFLEYPRLATTEESSVSDVATEDDHHSEINEDVLPPSADKVVPDNLIIDIPTDELISGKMYEDNSGDLTDEIEASNETLFSEKLTDVFLSGTGKSPDDIPDDLSVPPTKQVFSSRLPITKALLEKVLSNITDPHQ